MNAIVVDTDVISLVFKGDTRAERFMSAIAGPDLLVSFMTEAELERWNLQANWGAERIARFPVYMKRFVAGSLVSGFDREMGRDNGKGALRGSAAGGCGRMDCRHRPALRCTAGTNNPTDYAGVTGIQLLPNM